MRRKDLIQAIAKVAKGVYSSRMINSMVISSKKPDTKELLFAFQTYMEHFKQFDQNELKIVNIMGLDGLEDPKLWAGLFENNEEARGVFNRYRNAVRLTIDQLPKVISLLKQDNVEFTEDGSNSPTTKGIASGYAILTVILPEVHDEISKPSRLVKVLESIELLYQVNAKILSLDSSDLSVAAVDSGSDKSFDFLGTAKLIESVKEFILEMWDRIVFYKERQSNVRLDLIIKALPAIERIGELELAKTIGPEQAELLRRDIATATGNFISAGAIIPEFDNKAILNPRAIMSPEPKLLTNHNANDKDKKDVKISDNVIQDEDIDDEV